MLTLDQDQESMWERRCRRNQESSKWCSWGRFPGGLKCNLTFVIIANFSERTRDRSLFTDVNFNTKICETDRPFSNLQSHLVAIAITRHQLSSHLPGLAQPKSVVDPDKIANLIQHEAIAIPN